MGSPFPPRDSVCLPVSGLAAPAGCPICLGFHPIFTVEVFLLLLLFLILTGLDLKSQNLGLNSAMNAMLSLAFVPPVMVTMHTGGGGAILRPRAPATGWGLSFGCSQLHGCLLRNQVEKLCLAPFYRYID